MEAWGWQQAPESKPAAPTLAQARAWFARLDEDRDGWLDRLETERGGISPLARVDDDADGRLGLDEFIVGQHLARQQHASGDLAADSTRIQALWRARRAQSNPGREAAVGPSSRVSAARTAQGRAGWSDPGRRTVRAGQPPPPVGTPSQAATGSGAAQTPQSQDVRTESQPGLARLQAAERPGRQTSGLPSGSEVPSTLEARAKAVQQLLERRLSERQPHQPLVGAAPVRTFGPGGARRAASSAGPPDSKASPVPAPSAVPRTGGAGAGRTQAAPPSNNGRQKP